MKKVILSLVLSCFIIINALFSQSYLPVIEEGKVWYQRVATCDVGGGLQIELGADTLVEGRLYKEVLSTGCDEIETVGLIRSDSTNSKLWSRINGTDYLIMDMSLEPGDQFDLIDPDGQSISSYIVVWVETINGRKFMELLLAEHHVECLIGESKPIKFIEGIGPIMGLTHGNDADFFIYLLDCVYLGDSSIYKEIDLSWSDCNYGCVDGMNSSENLSSVTADIIRVYPNPLSALGRVKSEVLISNYKILDLNGRIIQSLKVDAKEFNFSTKGLENGMYYLVLSTEEQAVFYERILVQRPE